MIKLSLAPPEPRWITLAPDVEVLVRPYGSAVRVMAESLALSRLPAEASPGERRWETVAAMAEVAITEWRGVGDEAGAPLAVSPEAVRALMGVSDLYQAFELHYFGQGLVLEREKNGLPPSPSGASGAETTTAAPPASAPPADA